MHCSQKIYMNEFTELVLTEPLTQRIDGILIVVWWPGTVLLVNNEKVHL